MLLPPPPPQPHSPKPSSGSPRRGREVKGRLQKRAAGPAHVSVGPADGTSPILCPKPTTAALTHLELVCTGPVQASTCSAGSRVRSAAGSRGGFLFPKCVDEEGGERRASKPQNQELNWTQKPRRKLRAGEGVSGCGRGPSEPRCPCIRPSGWPGLVLGAGSEQPSEPPCRDPGPGRCWLSLELLGENGALVQSDKPVVRKVGVVSSQQRRKYLRLPEPGGQPACQTPGAPGTLGSVEN